MDIFMLGCISDEGRMIFHNPKPLLFLLVVETLSVCLKSSILKNYFLKHLVVINAIY